MTPNGKLTILFLAANPDGTQALKLDEEMRAIDDVLRRSEHRDRFELRSHWAVRYSDLQELLLRHNPHVVHFSGHGSPHGEIILQDAGGSVHPVPAATLSELFAVLRDNIRCVVLNACFSRPQAEGIAASIDCVVGMARAIADTAAIDFAAGFYLGLGYGRSVQTAFDLGCNRIGLADQGQVYRALRPPADEAAGQGAPSTAIPQLIALRSDPAQVVLAGAPPPVLPPTPPAAPARKLTRLSGQQYGQLQRALLDAFDEAMLEQMVRFELEENLAAIAGGGNLTDVVFDLVGWAQRTGNLDRLLDGALAQVPGNAALQAVNQALRG